METDAASEAEPVEEPYTWVLTSDAMTAQDEISDEIRHEVCEWLHAVAWEHAKRRGSRIKQRYDYIEREDVEYGGEHIRALLKLASERSEHA